MIDLHPGHQITVTPGPFGRAYLDCTCGLSSQTHPTTASANRAALRHHHDVAGCNCPPEVVANDIHPHHSTTPTSGPTSGATS